MIASMNAVALVKVVLIRKPEQRSKSAGGSYTLARGREGIGDGARFWTLFAFSETARAEIDRLDAGDAVAVQGSFDASLWEGRGKPEISLKINVDRAIALRPPARARKPKSTEREAAPQSWAEPAGQREEEPLDDALPF
jgi:hypothetical protein